MDLGLSEIPQTLMNGIQKLQFKVDKPSERGKILLFRAVKVTTRRTKTNSKT